MLLTCPTCRSGLQVPDGTTAMVRCPACKSVFSPAAGLAPPEPEEEPGEELERRRRGRDEEEDDDDRPRKKPKGPKPENPDIDPIDPDAPRRRRRRRVEDDDTLSPAERATLLAAFTRAAWGCKLIWISFALFMLAMVLISSYWFQTAFTTPSPAFLIGAGAIGAIYWALAAVGVGLCLSGPPSPGHWGYGIAAAVATGVHLILLVVLVSQGHEVSPLRGERDRGSLEVRWELVPTQLGTLTYYMAFIAYPDEDVVPKLENALPIVVGVAEMLRNVLILMLLSSLARSAGDDELSHRCTRAAGFACFGPGAMALIMFLAVATIVELNAQTTTLTKVVLTTVLMWVYGFLMGMMFPALRTSRETADACDEPFQSQIPKL